ncbi:hypothetical protein AB0B60_11100 [Streptomyces lincolnensis]|uniref:hypothetical protein n=2 Tax=Streptomyces lincolnensis TaxID=1915 RepID=UPI0013520CBE|nr:hypothetical protein [Streptomyces lincolnensis]
MEWTTLVATLLGAAIAMSTSLMVEIRKVRHDTESEGRRTRREIYAEYLTVLSQARWELSGVAADSELSDAARRARANEIFARCYQIRHQLELYSPGSVEEPALIYFRHLRDFRNAVRGGLRDGVPDVDAERAYADHIQKVKEQFGRCRDAMRADINPRGSQQRWRGLQRRT